MNHVVQNGQLPQGLKINVFLKKKLLRSSDPHLNQSIRKKSINPFSL